jgi:hypothetical protein
MVLFLVQDITHFLIQLVQNHRFLEKWKILN